MTNARTAFVPDGLVIQPALVGTTAHTNCVILEPRLSSSNAVKDLGGDNSPTALNPRQKQNPYVIPPFTKKYLKIIVIERKIGYYINMVYNMVYNILL
jgi:hypothetical protein